MRNFLTLMVALGITCFFATAADAQWAPLSGNDPGPEKSEIPEAGPDGEEEIRPGEAGGASLRARATALMGVWGIGSSDHSGPSLVPALGGGGGVAFHAFALELWILAGHQRESTAVVTVGRWLFATHATLSLTWKTREMDLAGGLLGGAAFGITKQTIAGARPQSEQGVSLRPVWGARVQLGWRWRSADPILEIQWRRRGWVQDLLLAFGFRFGGVSRE